jgi:hypothetical protein
MRFLHYSLITLALCVTWSAWQWLRPYDPNHDSPWQIDSVTVKRDHQFAWFEIELSRKDDATIAHPPLTRLVSDQQTTLPPADARLSADAQHARVRFWLDWPVTSQGWMLHIEDAQLRVKAPAEISLDPTQQRRYRHSQW